MINKYNKLVKEIVIKWATRYIKELYNEELEKRNLRIMDYEGIFWLWCIELCDEYHNLDDILIAEKYNIPAKIQQDYYYLYLEKDWKPWINLYAYFRKNV